MTLILAAFGPQNYKTYANLAVKYGPVEATQQSRPHKKLSFILKPTVESIVKSSSGLIDRRPQWRPSQTRNKSEQFFQGTKLSQKKYAN